jgi:hypothetical protein
MTCASRQNDLRSWQNDLRVISDVTNVLGKMMCALVCALMCAPMAGVPVARRKSFSSQEQAEYTTVHFPILCGNPYGRRHRHLHEFLETLLGSIEVAGAQQRRSFFPLYR